jgi:hypothetical protein
MRHLIKILFLVFIAAGILSCEKWYETADVSHVSYLPEFKLTDGDFISIVKQDSGEYADPGGIATVNGSQVNLYYDDSEVDITKPGLYVVYFYAENAEGFSKTTYRFVAVTYTDVSGNDLSGTYTGTLWDEVESRVTKINQAGLYKMTDVLGFPGYTMPGRFADLGDGQLVLLPGEGYFGEYGYSEGTYTKRTLSWYVRFLSDPYEGLEIPVTWRKKE